MSDAPHNSTPRTKEQVHDYMVWWWLEHHNTGAWHMRSHGAWGEWLQEQEGLGRVKRTGLKSTDYGESWTITRKWIEEVITPEVEVFWRLRKAP